MVAKESIEEVVRGADIVVGGTTSPDIVSREPWLKPGCTFISRAPRARSGRLVEDGQDRDRQLGIQHAAEGLQAHRRVGPVLARAAAWRDPRLVSGAKQGASATMSASWFTPPGLCRRTWRWHTSCIEERSSRASGSGCRPHTEPLGAENGQEQEMSSNSPMDRRGFLVNAGKAALAGTAAGSMGQFGASALAQEKFPARDVNWIIYQAPGGSIDTTARIIQPISRSRGEDQPRLCAGSGRARRAHQAAHRAAGRLR